MTMESINPATGKTIATYDSMDDATVDKIIEQMQSASKEWQQTKFQVRAELLHKAAAVLCNRQDELARLMVMEMGKTLASAEAEIEKCAWVCEYYADEGEKFLADETIGTDATLSKLMYRPLGTAALTR